MTDNRFEATYLIETPLDPAEVAEVMAGEQSCGTFARVAGETDELRERARAIVTRIEELESAAEPSLPNAWLARKGVGRAVAAGTRHHFLPGRQCRRQSRDIGRRRRRQSLRSRRGHGLRLESITLPCVLPAAFPAADARYRRHAPADRSRDRPARRLDHQAECRPERRADGRAGRAASVRPGSTSSRTTRFPSTRCMRLLPSVFPP